MTQPDYLAMIKERGQGALDIKMGIEMLEVSPERLVARMPVEGNTQPIGLLHAYLFFYFYYYFSSLLLHSNLLY